MIKLNNKTISYNRFPDGTLLLKQDFLKCECNIIKWYYENDEEIFLLYCLKRHLDESFCPETLLEMYYIPNSRQDRVKSSNDVFTLKYFAEIINSMNFSAVTVLDPHSYVSEALFNRIITESPIAYISKALAICNPGLLFYPDEGAMKRYSTLIKKEYAFGIKKRDWETGKIEGLDVSGNIDKIKESKVLIVDDICSKGGTFYHSAKRLKELGAKEVYLYVTHCENTILEGELLTSGLIEKVYTTNSIFTKEHEKIEVFKI